MNQYNLANTENRTRDKLHGFRCRVGGEIFPKKNPEKYWTTTTTAKRIDDNDEV